MTEGRYKGKSRMGVAGRLTLMLMTTLALTACNDMVDRLDQVGEVPKLSDVENPQMKPGYQAVSMPMPAPDGSIRKPNSLWQPGARAFFRDQRAQKVGDILSVTVDVSDQAVLNNQTQLQRTDTETGGMTNLLGFEGKLGYILPKSANPGSLINTNSTENADGQGQVTRNETITSKVAAVVTQVLPNGNLVIKGTQEITVNFELRELTVSGIVRPEDISATTNSIDYSQIAEARISYGGHGQITDRQQPRYGQQLIDILFPF